MTADLFTEKKYAGPTSENVANAQVDGAFKKAQHTNY